MKFPNLQILWTEGKRHSLPEFISRTKNKEYSTKIKDRTVENTKSFFGKTPFATNIECQAFI